jgi:hypothetical protein
MPKPRVNAPCFCGSTQKYKKCCMKKAEILNQNARERLEKDAIDGHDPSSKTIQTIVDHIHSVEPEVKVIDVTHIITPSTEKRICENPSTMILAERNSSNSIIFEKREKEDDSADIFVIYKGSFKLFNFATEWEQAKKILFDVK